jgi:hypothetical protein
VHTSHSASAMVRVPDAKTMEYERGRLSVAIPLSIHSLNKVGRFSRATRRSFAASAVLLLCMGSLALVVEMLKKQELPAAILGGCISFLLFYWGARLINSAVELYSSAVEDIVVCSDGLRWRKHNTEHLALWSEIESVKVYESAQQSSQGLQNWYARITIKVRGGDTLVLDSELLTDFVRFGNAVKARHAQRIQEGQNSGVAATVAGLPGRAGIDNSIGNFQLQIERARQADSATRNQ